jgi:alkyldihydroxyacetonephosphate synthase
VLALDPISLTVTAEAGIYGPELEAHLQQQGYTVGHTPQSFEFSTLGGWIAARGAGDRSNRYGKVEDMLVAATVQTPRGEWRLPAVPASAAGPDLRQVLAGSEGTLGIIREATLKIHPQPACAEARGFLFPDFLSGMEAVRALVQEESASAMIRLSDQAETQFLFRFRKKEGPEPLPRQLIKRWLASRGFAQPALLLLGQEGHRPETRAWVRRAEQRLKQAGAFGLGADAAASWHKSRYSTPYLRDTLLDHGIAVETLETATQWRRLPDLYRAMRQTLQQSMDQGLATGKGFVMTHISHCYPDGASLYFTFAFAPEPGHEMEHYRQIKHAACETLVAAGATLSHHHGIGRDHARWLKAEKGTLGMEMLNNLRRSVDPDGLLNPGKLTPD